METTLNVNHYLEILNNAKQKIKNFNQVIMTKEIVTDFKKSLKKNDDKVDKQKIINLLNMRMNMEMNMNVFMAENEKLKNRNKELETNLLEFTTILKDITDNIPNDSVEINNRLKEILDLLNK
jgi:hypothetical protein